MGIENITYAGNNGLEILHPDGTKSIKFNNLIILKNNLNSFLKVRLPTSRRV